MSEGQHIIEMDSDLYERVAAAVQPGDEIETIATSRSIGSRQWTGRACASRRTDPSGLEPARSTFLAG